MLKFEQRGNFPELNNLYFAEDMLEYHGIENPEYYLQHEEFKHEFLTKPENFYGIDRVYKLLNKFNSTKEVKKIGILVDDDADGFSSAAATIKLLKFHFVHDIIPIFHDSKSHGLSGEIEKIINTEVDLIIIPDAGSNDFKEQIYLLERGIQVLIIDHHEIDNQEKIEELYEKYPDKYAIINNQLHKNGEVNKNFVGVGMVYMFAKYLDVMYDEDFADELLDIVALGQIADASDISDYEIHHIVRRGIDEMKNGLMKEAFSDKLDCLEKVAPINLSFKIIPFINAVTRVGTVEEKLELIKGLSDYWNHEEKIVIEKRRKNKITGKFNKVKEEWTPYAIELDNLTKIRNRQNKEIKKIEPIAIENSFEGTIVIAPLSNDVITYRSITGLIANKVAQKFQKPTLMLVENNDGTYSGSARGCEKVFKDFRQWCLETGLFELAQGHDNAFGVVITKENLAKLIERYSDEEISEIVYEVDKIYENKTNLEEVKLINDNMEIFGGRVKVPMFGYKNLKVNRNCVSQRGSVITFFHGGLEFIMYKQEPGILDDFLMTLGFDTEVEVDLVGSPSRSDWNGNVKDQIVLDDFDIRKYEQKDDEDEDFDINNLVF